MGNFLQIAVKSDRKREQELDWQGMEVGELLACLLSGTGKHLERDGIKKSNMPKLLSIDMRDRSN